MSDSLGRRSLARAAARLAIAEGSFLPPLALFTDEDRLADPVAAASALPFGSIVIARARNGKRRAKLLDDFLPIGRARGLLLLVSDDEKLAQKADGLHLPEARAHEAAHWCARFPHWLISASVHSPRTFLRSQADIFFVSAVFATASHPGRAPLTPWRAGAIARLSARPVYALGGITARNAKSLAGLGFSGLAAVSALA
jgi:thiamine-phosphate pyrophosphorylase